MPFLRGNIRWILIFWIFVISAVAYLDRVNISIAGPAIRNEFGFTDIQLGWVFSAFVLGYAFAQAPAGRLADKVGPRLILLFGVIWWAVFTSLITILPPVVSALAFLIGLRFLLGVGEAVVYPASNCIVASWIPSTERGIANGFIFCGVGFGAGITPPLITYINAHHGWRASFWCSSLLGLIAGIVWYWIARNHPAQHPSVTTQERRLIEAGIPAHSIEDGARKLSWSSIFTDRDILIVTFSYFAYGYVAYIFFSWFFIYLSEVRGLNLKQSAIYTMLPFLAMAVGSPLGGWISDRLTKAYGKRTGRCGVAALWHWLVRYLYRARNTGSQRATRQHHSRRGCGCVISFAEFILVGERGYRGAIGRLGLGRDEHGRPIRRRTHRLSDPRHCASRGLERIVPGRRSRVRVRRSGLALGKSRRETSRYARVRK